jgi:hypothetical protein
MLRTLLITMSACDANLSYAIAQSETPSVPAAKESSSASEAIITSQGSKRIVPGHEHLGCAGFVAERLLNAAQY